MDLWLGGLLPGLISAALSAAAVTCGGLDRVGVLACGQAPYHTVDVRFQRSPGRSGPRRVETNHECKEHQAGSNPVSLIWDQAGV
jgi:hypothetical protein